MFSFHKCSKILSLVFHENFVLQKICVMKFPASILYTVVLHKISKPSIKQSVSHLVGGVDGGPCLEEYPHHTAVTIVG